MAKIPKFKNRTEEREFWATHSFADYADDTTKFTKPKSKDTNTTRQKSSTVNVYLTAAEGLALEELCKKLGESKTMVIRQALRKLMATEGVTPGSVAAKHLGKVSVPKIAGQITYIGVLIYSEDPNRDRDLARKLKRVVLVAYPGTRVEVLIKNTRGHGVVHEQIADYMAAELEIKGSLSEAEREKIKKSIRVIARETIGAKLRSRHPETVSVEDDEE